MQTQTSKGIVIESAVATAVALSLAALLSPDGGVGLGSLSPHPLWIAVAVMAARYGSRALAVSLPMCWGMALVAAVLVESGVSSFVAHLSTGAEMGALVGVVLIAWIASTHNRRTGELVGTVRELRTRTASQDAVVAELRSALVGLRSRADRLEISLSFLRDVASRLEGKDPVTAAQAALELAMARIGARAAVVEALGAGDAHVIASAGLWSSGLGVAALAADQTIAAAIRNGRASRALDLAAAGPDDSDLAAPIQGNAGELLGVIAVRGVPQGGAGMAALHDLAIIASWCAKALGGSRSAQQQLGAAAHTDREGRGPGGGVPLAQPSAALGHIGSGALEAGVEAGSVSEDGVAGRGEVTDVYVI